MKEINNYICIVDGHRRPSRCRNTYGRYRVGAKTEKEAIALLREKIKFGSIQLYYKCDLKKEMPSQRVGYKEVVKEELSRDANDKVIFAHVPVKSAIDPRRKRRTK